MTAPQLQGKRRDIRQQLPNIQCLTTSTMSDKSKEEKIVLYKGPWMVPLYVMVRLKVFQLVGFGSLAVPLSAWITGVSCFHCMAQNGLVQSV